MCSVFILYEHQLFANGLAELLRQAGAQIAGVAAKGRAAYTQIRNTHPDVILTESEKDKCDAAMLLFRFLRENERACVVRLSLEDKTAACYSGRRFQANTVEELVNCVVKPSPA